MSMEPLIITVDSNGKVAMSVSEIKALLDKAYKMGRDSGNRYYTWYPSNVYSTQYATISGTSSTPTANGGYVTNAISCTKPEICINQKEPDNG